MTPLRILVPVKRVIDYAVRLSPHPVIIEFFYVDLTREQVKPRVNAAHTAVETVGVKMSMNPFDELSLEESIRLRERHTISVVSDILAFSAGPVKAQDTLRTAMAMGADRALHVDTGTSEADLEPLAVAKLLREVVKSEDRNLVILGKQSIDDDSGQTGQMLAGLLGWSQATQASKVELLEGGRVRVTKEVDGGEEVVEAPLPMIVTTDLRLNEPYVVLVVVG